MHEATETTIDALLLNDVTRLLTTRKEKKKNKKTKWMALMIFLLMVFTTTLKTFKHRACLPKRIWMRSEFKRKRSYIFY